MKKFRKLSIMFLALIMLVGCIHVLAFAEEPIIKDSGKCGESVTWELNSKGVLTIAGTGEMGDYFEMPIEDGPEMASNTTPYSEYFKDITEVVVEEGVTRIGDGAFINLWHLKTLILPKTLQNIGEYVFINCGEEWIVRTDNQETIGRTLPLIKAPEGSFAEQYAKENGFEFKRIFTDTIKLSDGPKAAIEWADEVGIVKGYDDGTFRPDEICTRKQMVVMLWRLAGKPAPETIESAAKFNDVDGLSSGVMQAMAWAVESKIIVGYKDGSFRPEEKVTRQQTVTMLWRLADRPAPKSKETNFTDMDGVNSGILNAVYWACENGITKGSRQADGTYKFNPQDGCKRQHSATFIYRYARDILVDN